MVYKNIMQKVGQTNNIRIINQLLSKCNFMDFPYHYLKKFRNMLVMKERDLYYQLPEKVVYVPTLLFWIFLNIISFEFKWVVWFLKIIATIVFHNFIKPYSNNLVKMKYPNNYALQKWNNNIKKINTALEIKERSNLNDFLLSQESPEVALEKIFNPQKEIKDKNTNSTLKFTERLNKCLEMSDNILAWKTFLAIEKDIKQDVLEETQNYAFKILPKYFLLLVAKTPGDNLFLIIQTLDVYFLSILINYLCYITDYQKYLKNLFYNSKEELQDVAYALVLYYLSLNQTNELNSPTLDANAQELARKK